MPVTLEFSGEHLAPSIEENALVIVVRNAENTLELVTAT